MKTTHSNCAAAIVMVVSSLRTLIVKVLTKKIRPYRPVVVSVVTLLGGFLELAWHLIFNEFVRNNTAPLLH